MPSYSHLCLALANIAIPAFILVFASGFFPYKPFLPGLAQYEALSHGPIPEAPFDRLIFMVVDALRSDFVYLDGSGFQFTQELIRNGAAFPFTANARPPTITMPRIKAITTGSIPSFVDVILNLDEGDTTATLATQDSWLAQMKRKATGSLVMYGDDTWLKLFPDTFDRADGTSSFFVSDFTEVDNNVTRHLAGELARDDWSVMVLHYLGLDHIGHKSGPRGPNMLPKQREMDLVVREIFDAMQSQEHMASALLVLCGDHGMNDAGNHGASSAGEMSPALVFVSPKLRALGRTYQAPVPYVDGFRYYSAVEQSDIVPTLAALLGFPVPKNNLGTLIQDFIDFWPSPRDRALLLIRNALQVRAIITAALSPQARDLSGDEAGCSGGGDDMYRLICRWDNKLALGVDQLGLADRAWVSSTMDWLKESQDLLSNVASNYDVPRLIVGQLFNAIACVVVLIALLPRCRDWPAPVLITALLHGAMMFGSSYVEEEHQFWHWITPAWLAYLAARHLRSVAPSSAGTAAFALSLVASRVVRGWNQTGQKFAGAPDMVKTFILPHPYLLWALVALAYLGPLGMLLWHPRSGIAHPSLVFVATCTVSLAFGFKLAFTSQDEPGLVVGRLLEPLARFATAHYSLVGQARAVFLGIGLMAAFVICRRVRTPTDAVKLETAEALLHLYTLFAMTQSRVTNVPLFLLYHVQLGYLRLLRDLTVVEITTTLLILQHASFFAAGGSNSIASVDLSSAYNGIGSFSVVAVGILTFVGNWAGSIYWTVATNVLLLRRCRRGPQRPDGAAPYATHVALLTLFTGLAAGSVMAACTVLRTHLFIWTVFSPKYLYCMAWSLVQHLVVNIGLGGVLFQLGR